MRIVMQIHKPGDSDLEKFTREIENNPLDSRAYYKRGTLKAEMGDHAGASQDFKKFIELEMREAREYYNLGVNKYKKGNLQEASVLFDKAIALDWRFAYSAAMEDFSTAIKLNKDLKFS
jgi:tetratricopeptide (TPR) repeat protein